MTIEKGRPWGREVARPPDLVVLAGDHEVAVALQSGATAVAVADGDLHRTIGAPSIGGRERVLALPVDLLEVTLDDGDVHPAVAHVVARSPWWRGSWWRGPVLAVMNAEFLGRWDVAPRGHPNDGRVEVQLADPALSVRERWSARSRLGHGGHIPHPSIATSSVRSGSWTFDRALDVAVDGRSVGRSRTVGVRVRPDAATVYA